MTSLIVSWQKLVRKHYVPYYNDTVYSQDVHHLLPGKLNSLELGNSSTATFLKFSRKSLQATLKENGSWNFQYLVVLRSTMLLNWASLSNLKSQHRVRDNVW